MLFKGELVLILGGRNSGILLYLIGLKMWPEEASWRELELLIYWVSEHAYWVFRIETYIKPFMCVR